MVDIECCECGAVTQIPAKHRREFMQCTTCGKALSSGIVLTPKAISKETQPKQRKVRGRAKKTNSYFAKYDDPRWQRKRLEILQRDDFACSFCSESDSTLHVHHGYYEANTDPWDYPNASLHTVCEECHKDAELLRKGLRSSAGCLWLESQNELMKAFNAMDGLINGEKLMLITEFKKAVIARRTEIDAETLSGIV